MEIFSHSSSSNQTCILLIYILGKDENFKFTCDGTLLEHVSEYNIVFSQTKRKFDHLHTQAMKAIF